MSRQESKPLEAFRAEASVIYILVSDLLSDSMRAFRSVAIALMKTVMSHEDDLTSLFGKI